MKVPEALRRMVRGSGLTAIEISRKIGRKDNYVSSLLSRGSVPTAETLASIAEASGWRLCLVSDGETVDLDGWAVQAQTSILIDGEQPIEESEAEAAEE